MNKQEIITLAESMGFVLDHDKYDEIQYPGESNNLRYLRFVSTDKTLDEKDLRWIWYKEDSDEDNLVIGKHIKYRLDKKRGIINSLKY